VTGDFHDDLAPLGRMFIHVHQEESTPEGLVLERE